MNNLKWQIGDVTITRIVESDTRLPLAMILPAAVPAALERHRHWLQPYFLDAQDHITISFHCLVIESRGKVIVVDTCLGEHGNPFAPDNSVASDFLEQLAAAGFPREKVDVVLCTHMHYDHVGWNTMKQNDEWVPTFPNARYFFAREEYQHWETEPDNPVNQNFNDAVQAVFTAGLAELVPMDYRITDEICLVPTPGHSPGHVSVLIQSHGEQGFITGDMTHHPVQWAEPDWSLPMVDYNELQGAETRRRVAAQYAGTNTLIIGTHYPTPTAGHLIYRDGEFRFTTDN